MRSPREIATWRYEQIAPFLDATLNSADQRRVMKDRCAREVVWPNGKKKRISKSTLHRWIRAFAGGGYLALMPTLRSDRGKPRRDTEAWIDYAIAMLFEQPKRSLYQLESYLKLEFDGYRLGRSTLSRHLHAHPAYRLIEKLRGKRSKLRGLYEAKHPHESWQLDGKGPFRVRLMSGERIFVHVLTVLDDFSRAVLATVVAGRENTKAAIEVLQKAAQRYGIPDRMQFDRGSAFDSDPFRHGLAQLGVHRNAVKVKQPQYQGKIEAYHKSLQRWFIDELKVQQVRDLKHLQELLDAAIALLYQEHPHRRIGGSPRERLAQRISSRRLSASDLARAFFVEIEKKSDRITGEVILPNGSFLVPREAAGQRSRFRYDILQQFAVWVRDDRREIPIEPFSVRPLPKAPRQGDRPQGQLQKLVERWRGREIDNAEAAFGLPEVFLALKNLVGRFVPSSESEAKQIQDFWSQWGPLAKAPFLTACDRTRSGLGQKRPLSVYLDHLARQIQRDRNQKRNEDGEVAS